MTEYTQHLAKEVEAEKPEPNYFLVFGALATITVIEIMLAANLPTAVRVPLLVVLSLAKVVLVAMYYMHLKFSTGWFTAIFLIPIPFMLLITVVLAVALAPSAVADGSAAAAANAVCSFF